jgi:sporulation protein YlmC with PRC-barrel domain
MNHTNVDTSYEEKSGKGPGPRLMGAETLIGDDVCNLDGEVLGDIKEIMLDTASGTICYAVLSFGGIFGMGEKLFAVPWNALKLDTENKRFELSVEKGRLKMHRDLIRTIGPTWQTQPGRAKSILTTERVQIYTIGHCNFGFSETDHYPERVRVWRDLRSRAPPISGVI